VFFDDHLGGELDGWGGTFGEGAWCRLRLRVALNAREIRHGLELTRRPRPSPIPLSSLFQHDLLPLFLQHIENQPLISQ